MTDDFGNTVEPPVVEAINRRLDDGEARMTRIEANLQKNTEATESMAASMQDLLDFFVTLKKGFQVLEWIGRLAKPIGALLGVAAAGTSLWAAIKGLLK